MNSEHDRLSELFRLARELEPADRRGALEGACDDASLIEEVLDLLRHDRPQASLDGIPTAVQGLTREFEGSTPRSIGSYRIVRRIGAGGMGIVYEAEQQNPSRRVALKVLRAALDPGMLRRFEVEAQVLGWLDHPGIARIFEAGTAETERGTQPFFAMELVRGKPILAYARAHELPLATRLELIAAVCDAIQHAHQKGVIHRDLKPGNILIDEFGAPRVLDFGIARVTNSDLRGATLETRAGDLIGTLPYMSPEQVSGDPAAIDTRSDVYALGVLTYELLSDRLPLEIRDSAIHEAVRIVVEEEPPRLGSLDPRCRGDVEIIVGRALEKDKDRRYASARELGDDIRRYLNDEPVVARAPSATYQLGKFVRRNRVLVGGVAATVVALAVGLGVSLKLYFEERDAEQRATNSAVRAKAALVLEQEARDEAEAARARAESTAELLLETQNYFDGLFVASSPFADGADVRVVDILKRTIEGLDGAFPDQPLARARLLRRVGITYSELGQHQEGLALLKRAQDLFDKVRTEPDLERAQLSAGLAVSYGKLLDFQTSLDFADDAIARFNALSETPVGADYVARACRVQALRTLSRVEESLLAAEENVARAERDGDERFRGRFLTHLALIELSLGRLQSGEEHAREAVLLGTQFEGRDELHVLDAAKVLSALLSATGERTKQLEAVQLLEQNFEIMERLIEGDHIALTEALQGLGVLNLQLGRANDGLGYLERGLAMSNRLWGGTYNRSSAAALGLIAAVKVQRGEFEEAEAIMLESNAILRELEPGGGALASNLANLGNLYGRLGRIEEMAGCYEEAVRLRSLVSDPTHPRIDVDRTGLLDALDLLNDFEAAERHHAARVEARRVRLGPDHLETLQAELEWALSLAALKRWDEAQPLIDAIELRADRVFGSAPDWRAAVEITSAWVASRGGVLDEHLERLDLACRQLRAMSGAHPIVVRRFGGVFEELRDNR